MPHLLEAPVRCVNTSADDSEALTPHLLGEQIVFGEEYLLVKSAKLAEFFHVEQHKHSRGEGMMEAREILKSIVAQVEQLVDPAAVSAKNVRCYTMKLFTLRQFHGAANHGRVCKFDIGIEKENINALGLSRAQVASY